MPLSRQFLALLRLTALWALPWPVAGVLVGILRWLLLEDLRQTGISLPAWLLNHALGYGAVGVISGLYLGLLLPHLVRRTSWSELSTRKLALWAAAAGAAPGALFAALGLIFGAPSAAILPLALLSAVTAAGSAVLASKAHAMTVRSALNGGEERVLPP